MLSCFLLHFLGFTIGATRVLTMRTLRLLDVDRGLSTTTTSVDENDRRLFWLGLRRLEVNVLVLGPQKRSLVDVPFAAFFGLTYQRSVTVLTII
jgi:hypothetical protein